MKYVKAQEGLYYYADEAIPRLLHLLGKEQNAIASTSLELVVAGGLDMRGPILETLSELGLEIVAGHTESEEPKLKTASESRYGFRLVGYDIVQNLHRRVRFDASAGTIIVERRILFSKDKTIEPRLFSL